MREARPFVLIPQDLTTRTSKLPGRRVSEDCWLFSQLSDVSGPGVLWAQVLAEHESLELAVGIKPPDCVLRRTKYGWAALDVQGSSFDLILYAPPKRERHQLWTFSPLALVSEPNYTEPTEASTVSRQIIRSQRLAFGFDVNSGKKAILTQELLDAVNHLGASPSTRTCRPLASKALGALLQLLSFALQPFTVAARTLVYLWSLRLILGNSAKDLSAVAQQCDVRAVQLLEMPHQLRLAHSASDGRSLLEQRTQYVRLYTTLWLVLNDVIVGLALASLLAEYDVTLASHLERVIQKLAVADMKAALLWLNAWPLGLKLNTELAQFFCDAFLFFLNTWNHLVIEPLLRHLPSVVHLIAYSACGGTTLALACVADLVSICTFHVWLFYIAGTAIYSWHLSVLYALSNIFRGKKYNVIRRRLEPASYELDRLLLGTILFTLAAFLFPTVVAFYLLFASVRILVLFTHALVELLLAFLNHFPLFALMLRVKDPGRLPNGLQFDVLPCGTLLLKSRPMSFSDIFAVSWGLARRIYHHYSPGQMLLKVCKGVLILPIPRARLRSRSEGGPG